MSNGICLKPDQSYVGRDRSNMSCYEAPASPFSSNRFSSPSNDIAEEGIEGQKMLGSLATQPAVKKDWRDWIFEKTGMYIYKFGEGVVGTSGAVYGCGCDDEDDAEKFKGVGGSGRSPQDAQEDNTVTACTEDEECTEAGEKCVAGRCGVTECSSHEDCPDDTYCNSEENPPRCQSTQPEEKCNGKDDDRDAMVDETEGSEPGRVVPLRNRVGEAEGRGECGLRDEVCEGGQWKQPTRVTEKPVEQSCDGLDNDCDDLTDEELKHLLYPDNDEDGFGSMGDSIESCEENVPGYVGTTGDCDDGNLAIYPDALEICDDLDNDCDGRTDEELGETTCGVGACKNTTQNCINGASQMCVALDPSPEACDGVDNDCEGATDNIVTTPEPRMPDDGLVLAPTRVYLSWKLPDVDGVMRTGYELCWTNSSSEFLNFNDPDRCPNSTPLAHQNFHVMDVTSDTNYVWKVRARCDEQLNISPYSPARSFSTDNSVVSWWKFEGNVNDSVGTNHGTRIDGAHLVANGDPCNGSPASNLVNGGALCLDGVEDPNAEGDHVVIEGSNVSTSSLHLSDAVSVEAIVNPTPVNSEHGEYGVAAKGQVGGGGDVSYGLSMFANFDRVQFYFYVGYDTFCTSQGISDIGTGRFLAGTFSPLTGLRCYLDDSDIFSINTESPPSIPPSGKPVRIGWDGSPLHHKRYFHGVIDDVVIYNRALPPEVVMNHYCGAEALAGTDPMPPPCQ